MHLAHLRLRDFRNYARMDVDFSPGFHLLLGDNAQGKTNILEAIYLLATLRSFRGVGSAQIVRHAQKGYFVGARVVSQTQHDIKLFWSSTERRLTKDNQPIRKLSDYFGLVRAVVFCTEDLQLVKGTSRIRRRFVDLLLAQTHPVYLPLLQRYAAALRSRNALLRQRNEKALEAFTRELVDTGNQLIRFRRELLPQIAPLAKQCYERISGASEQFEVTYDPAVKRDFAAELAANRDRELAMRITLIGPHRDDLQLRLDNKSAAKFASEGQKRSIAIALKMTQAEHLTTIHGAPPILLIDDIMGELDARRRAAFLPLLNRAQHARSQVFMTCTEENWPRELGRDLQRWEVVKGELRPKK
ncbi:MAG: replication and repair protein RecF [Verrucomicrobiales bacterium]|nr:replication and repair protein RecF [Verrucomicrobiales bacterium]